MFRESELFCDEFMRIHVIYVALESRFERNREQLFELKGTVGDSISTTKC